MPSNFILEAVAVFSLALLGGFGAGLGFYVARWIARDTIARG
ncbi:hypothetical protein [Rhodobacter sp. NTK016B]|nr:hypothetical protein [Rhodobacter sp. NTK016B]